MAGSDKRTSLFFTALKGFKHKTHGPVNKTFDHGNLHHSVVSRSASHLGHFALAIIVVIADLRVEPSAHKVRLRLSTHTSLVHHKVLIILVKKSFMRQVPYSNKNSS
jgi:hypothetical protein